MPVSLVSLPNAVKSAAARGVREGIKEALPPRFAQAASLAGGLTVFLAARRSWNRWEDRKRLERIEQKLNDLARAVDGSSPP